MDKVVNKLWASTFPLLDKDPGAFPTCRALHYLVQIRAESYTACDLAADRIHRALHDFGIPKQQWDKFNDRVAAIRRLS